MSHPGPYKVGRPLTHLTDQGPFEEQIILSGDGTTIASGIKTLSMAEHIVRALNYRKECAICHKWPGCDCLGGPT